MATTNIDTSLPDLELAPGSTITVDTGDASATVSLLNVYTLSPVSGARSPVSTVLGFEVLLAHDMGARAPSTQVPFTSPVPAPEPVPLPPGPAEVPVLPPAPVGQPVDVPPRGPVIETDF